MVGFTTRSGFVGLWLTGGVVKNSKEGEIVCNAGEYKAFMWHQLIENLLFE